MRLDLAKPLFTQAAVCEITGLSRSTIQTRVNRGEVVPANPHPGRHSNRLFSTLDLIKLYFIRELTGQGITAAIATHFADEIAIRAVEWWDEEPETLSSDGIPEIVLKVSEWKRLKQGYLSLLNDGRARFSCVSLDEEKLDIMQTILPDVYITVQVDAMISRIINKVHCHLHENPAPMEKPK